ncbi:MAG: DNA-directed RNA polymerase subunit delta [Firmicutes bacterium]|nr:DNA-directed RNA polymerase subunit delta [Bacillota bacterium]
MENKKRTPQNETDVAYQILRERKAPMHYRELILTVLERMGQSTENLGPKLAQIHTEINLDSRFSFLGQGMWGLQAWAPRPASKAGAPEPSERRYQPKASDYMWDEEEEEDIDDEDELLVPADDDDSLIDEEDDELDDLAEDLDDLLLDDEELLDDELEDEDEPEN